MRAHLGYVAAFIVFSSVALTACSSEVVYRPPFDSGGALGQASWVSPGTTSIKKLIYLSDPNHGSVHVYNYSTGALVGTLKGFARPEGACVDGKGNVYIVDYAYEKVLEYEHGGKSAIKTLDTIGSAVTCSVSPDGDLAVANYQTSRGQGDVVIFKGASGQATAYSNKNCFYLQDGGYDGKGNFYVQAFSYASKQVVCEVPRGSKTMKTVRANAHVTYPDGVMWDGQELTLADDQPVSGGGSVTTIYRMRESASGDLTQGGKVVLTDSACPKGSEVAEPFIVGAVNTPLNKKLATAVVGPLSGGDCAFGFWNYPSGKDPTKTIKVDQSSYGQTVSIAP